MKAKDLEGRIRERAGKELKDELDRLLQPFLDRSRIGRWVETDLVAKSRPNSTLGIADVLGAARDVLFKALLEEHGDKAVAAFEEKVRELGDQIEDLRSEIGG